MKPEKVSNAVKTTINDLVKLHTGHPFGAENVHKLITLVHDLAPPKDIYVELLALLQKTPKKNTVGYRAVIFPDGSGHLNDHDDAEISGSRFSRGQSMLDTIKKFAKTQCAIDIETVERHLAQQDSSCPIAAAAWRLLAEMKKKNGG